MINREKLKQIEEKFRAQNKLEKLELKFACEYFQTWKVVLDVGTDEQINEQEFLTKLAVLLDWGEGAGVVFDRENKKVIATHRSGFHKTI